MIKSTATLGIFLLAPPGHAIGQTENKDQIDKGQSTFAVAGARPSPIPFGKVSSTNINQDNDTDLGDWTDQ